MVEVLLILHSGVEMKRMLNIAAGTILAVSFAGSAAVADEFQDAAKAYVTEKVMPWLESDEVVAAIKAQNEKNAGLAQGDIDALDKQWRAEVDASSRPLIDSVISNALSAFLKSKKDEASGLVTEMFVMDNRGLNVGQSDVTSDYWQGDEGKWKKTYMNGPDTVFVDEVEKDESTQALQTQVSVTIKDPADGKAIGAITVGVNVEQL